MEDEAPAEPGEVAPHVFEVIDPKEETLPLAPEEEEPVEVEETTEEELVEEPEEGLSDAAPGEEPAEETEENIPATGEQGEPPLWAVLAPATVVLPLCRKKLLGR